MDFSLITINETSTPLTFWVDKIIYCFGLAITAWFGWMTYKGQQKEARLHDDYQCFNTLFFSVLLNSEFAFSLLNKTNSSIAEIDLYIENLEKMKYFI